jgi:hypothetical protein
MANGFGHTIPRKQNPWAEFMNAVSALGSGYLTGEAQQAQLRREREFELQKQAESQQAAVNKQYQDFLQNLYQKEYQTTLTDVGDARIFKTVGEAEAARLQMPHSEEYRVEPVKGGAKLTLIKQGGAGGFNFVNPYAAGATGVGGGGLFDTRFKTGATGGGATGGVQGKVQSSIYPIGSKKNLADGTIVQKVDFNRWEPVGYWKQPQTKK